MVAAAVAVVNQRLTNELVRRVERVTGDLARSREALLTVQNVTYCAGNLTA